MVRFADLAPVVARRMGDVDQFVVLIGRPVRNLEEGPGAVVEVHGEAPLGRRVESVARRTWGDVGHGRFLSDTSDKTSAETRVKVACGADGEAAAATGQLPRIEPSSPAGSAGSSRPGFPR
jgi:hypothetical protein